MNRVLHPFFRIEMVHTQQSAVKSTGGISERRPPPSRPRAASRRAIDAIMSSPPSSPRLASPPAARQVQQRGRGQGSTNNANVDVRYLILQIILCLTTLQWCYSCVDRGDMIICDLCSRTICTIRCIKLPNIESLGSSQYWFACPTCHNDVYKKNPSPYFVSCFHFN